MGFLDPDKVAATQIGFSAIFSQQFGQLRQSEAPKWDELATVVDTMVPTIQYNWLGTNPAFQQWRGERKIGKIRNFNYTITVDDWANGIEVDENDIEDDQLGLYRPQIQRMAEQAEIHRVNLMVDFLLTGFAATAHGAGYDGLPYFSAAHQEGDGPTQSNLITATLDDTGAYDSAWQKLLELKDESSEPLNSSPTHLLVGPSNRANARAILQASTNAAGATNVNFNTTQLIVSAKITGADAAKWFLLDLSHAMKPLIFLRRREVRFDSVGVTTENTSDKRFLTRKMFFGASARYNVGYGPWQLAVGSNGTT